MDHRDTPSTREVFDRAANAIKRGDIARGKEGLLWVLESDPENVLTWLWMSRCVEGADAKLKCFHRVLAIDPTNKHALNAIQTISATRSQPKETCAAEKQGDPPSAADPRQPTAKRRRAPLILLGVLAPIALCICGFLIIGRLINPPKGGAETAARVLSAKEVFEVNAVDAVEADGYTLTSGVCEVVSPPSFLPSSSIFRIFHAFRLTGPDLDSEIVVLFASNRTAADGGGLVLPVNAEAIGLNQGFTPGSSLVDPVTVDTPGAQTALSCARRVGAPASLELADLDVEAWRSEAIERFGPEMTFDDGSKLDYVRLALSICKKGDAEVAAMEANLGAEYEGSFQQFVIDTFCPYD